MKTTMMMIMMHLANKKFKLLILAQLFNMECKKKNKFNIVCDVMRLLFNLFLGGYTWVYFLFGLKLTMKWI